MKLGIENRRQAILAAILAPVALVALYVIGSQFFSSSPTAPPPAAVHPAQTATTNTESANAVRSSERLSPLAGKPANPYDPTLHPEIMAAAEHLEYTGNGRNIFSATSAPIAVNIPRPIASARNTPVNFASARVGPAGPPPIPLKAFGLETSSNGTRHIFLQHDEDVFMAQTGDVVMRQYKVTNITANSVEITDLPNNNKQVLPIAR